MMKKNLLLLLIAIAMITACTVSPRDAENNKIIDMEEQLANDTTLVLDRSTAVSLIKMYSDFASQFPEDTLAALYLFKAGELSMNMNMGNQAITYFTKVLNEYSKFDKRPETIFLQAFVFENQLKNEKRATELYQTFMDQYPDHILFKDAKASIANMGKTLEEIIQGFEKQNMKKEEFESSE
jgi:tetratricopeptide (TPR) repeat protein